MAEVKSLAALIGTATALVEEAIIVSLLQDSDLTKASKAKKVEASLQKLDKYSAELGDLKAKLHPAILKEANRCIC